MTDIVNYNTQIEAEYIEETVDLLDEIEVIIQQLSTGSEEGKQRFKYALVKLSNLCATGQHTSNILLNVTMHRFLNYLNGLAKPNIDQIRDTQIFTDTMNGILDGTVTHDGYDFSEFVRSLPVRRPLDIEDIEHLDIEIMVVETKRTAAHIIERELQACGYVVVIVKSPLEAISLAIKTKPDMIISSAELDDISGIDLACAISAMPRTKNIPFCLLTSYDRGHKKLLDLPDSVAILSKGKDFSDNFADALTRFKIA